MRRRRTLANPYNLFIRIPQMGDAQGHFLDELTFGASILPLIGMTGKSVQCLDRHANVFIKHLGLSLAD